MSDHDNSYLNRILPQNSEQRKIIVLQLVNLTDKFNLVFERLEIHSTIPTTFFSKLTHRPPREWISKLKSSIEKSNEVLDDAQNSLDRLEEIWPQGITALSYYQNLLNQFKDLLVLDQEITEFDWNYLKKLQSNKFDELTVKKEKSLEKLFNDAKRLQVISKNLIEELENQDI